MHGMELPEERSPICRKGFPDGNLRIGYVWESAISGHVPILENQMQDMQGCHRIFHDKIDVEPGVVVSPRTQLEEMLKFLEEGDTLVVHCISSLGTTLLDTIFLLP